MFGIMRRGQEENERERARERERERMWRRSIKHQYMQSAVSHEQAQQLASLALGSTHDEFCLALLESLASSQVPQALADLEHGVVARERPTLRCRIFGCVPLDRCALHPYCTDCQSRCARCGISVVPRAVSRTISP